MDFMLIFIACITCVWLLVRILIKGLAIIDFRLLAGGVCSVCGVSSFVYYIRG